MIHSRLIMLEGLPGTGKTTNSYFLLRQLERNKNHAKWIHEVARPHPTLFFDEARFTHDEFHHFLNTYPQCKHIFDQIAMQSEKSIGIDMLEIEWNYMDIVSESAYRALQTYDVWGFTCNKYMEIALEKWKCFVDKVLSEKNMVYILDSSVFQYQIFSFLLQNVPYEDLERFVSRLIDIVSPLHPALIYFCRTNIEDTIQATEKARGIEFLERIWERDQHEPYYQNKPKGAEGHKQFLRDYASTAKRLYGAVDCRKMAIEITNGDWKLYEDQMLSFLDIEYIAPPDTLPRNGTYVNERLNFQITITELTMTDPNGMIRQLSPKSAFEFYVENLPVILHFDESEQIVTTGEQICERWTTLGTAYLKV